MRRPPLGHIERLFWRLHFIHLRSPTPSQSRPLPRVAPPQPAAMSEIMAFREIKRTRAAEAEAAPTVRADGAARTHARTRPPERPP